MDLPRDGEEFARITFSDLPDGVTVEASIDRRVTWVPTLPGDAPNEVRLLVRGPDSTAIQGVRLAGSAELWVRVVDAPETVVRPVGIISIV